MLPSNLTNMGPFAPVPQGGINPYMDLRQAHLLWHLLPSLTMYILCPVYTDVHTRRGKEESQIWRDKGPGLE